MLIPFKKNLCSKYATKMLSIKINNTCNAKCAFCVDKGGRNGKVIDIEKIAEKANLLTEYKTVIITGGEPFLVFDKVIELLKLLRPNKERIVLNTNGSLLTPDKTLVLNPLIDELQISIHNPDEEVNNSIFSVPKFVFFSKLRFALKDKKFLLSINSTFNNSYKPEERINAVDKMASLCQYLHADNLRLTELKKVDETQFVPASDFFKGENMEINNFCNRSSDELITQGCTLYYFNRGLIISVKRLCEYAKGKNAPAFSCCFINEIGQKKIDVDTKDTFKVIYSDGLVTDDWIFNK